MKTVNMAPRTNKGQLMKLVFGDDYRNIDSALPMSIWKELDSTFWFVMDYRNGLGTLVDMRKEATIICNGEVQEPIELTL